ncbi:hypothetical protein GBAR_LOCUS23070 [Geodia barretti]|nr:hypothetical protein GBAR_LOCUS23070 [Geodia barretti]
MMLLDPGRKQSLDALTYFLPNRKRESSSSGEGEGEGLLADLPVEGLKRRHRGGGGGRRGRGRGKSTTRGKSGNKNKTTSRAGLRGTRSVCGSHLQPTIVQSLADAKLTTRSSTTPRLSKSPPQLPGGRQRKSSSDIDELFGMGPCWLSDNEEEEEEKETQSKDPVDSSATSTGDRGSLSLSDTTLCGVANGDNFTGGIDVPPGSPIACPSSPAKSSRMSFSDPKRRGNEVETERRRDDGEIKGQGEEMAAGDSYRGEGAAEDRVQREISPDLWSLDSGSQPLDDITNSMLGTSTASPPPHGQRKAFSPTSSQQDCLRGGAPGDETGEWAVIVIDSDDEEAGEVRSASSPGSQGIKAQEKRKRNKRKVVCPEILFRGAKELRDIPERNVSRWLAQQKQLMVEIFQRRVYSRRHESFISGTRGRAVLLHQISHHLFTKGQGDAITSGLMNAFCYKNMNLFSYVMSVLYPESLIRLIMDYYSISFEEAERKMMGLGEVLEMDSDV